MKNLKSIKSYMYSENGEKVMCIMEEYDKSGRMIVQKSYSQDGKESYVNNNTYELDDNGNVVVEIKETVDDKFVSIYTYDENNNLLSEEKYKNIDFQNNQKECIYRSVYEYKDNRCIKNISIQYNLIRRNDAEGNLITGDDKVIVEYEYDSEGNCVKKTKTHYRIDELQETVVYTYDELKETQLHSVYQNGSECVSQYIQEYNYDSYNNLIKITISEKDNVYVSYKSEVDEKGNIIQEAYHNTDGTVRDLIKWKYGEKNIVYQLMSNDGKEVKTTITREYDENNKLVLISYANGTDKVYMIEEFEYYE